MALKEAKSLQLLPRLSATEKRIFSVLSSYGISSPLDISSRGGLSKARVLSSLEKLLQRGLVVEVPSADKDSPRYAAVFPIRRFTAVVDKLIHSLEARRDELEATSQLVNDFTENAIKTVREASVEERKKRNERSEEDIKDLEMALDASFSGILASVETDLQDLKKIAQTSREFLTESSIRCDETVANISHSLVPLKQKYTAMIKQAQQHIEDQLEATVDERVGNVLEFEMNANRAFNEVVEVFKASQDAFEEIIFNVLDAGIENLEKVTRPISDQIEEAITSLKVAIKKASNNFQTEIIRVLTEQKRPIINAVDSLRPKMSKLLKNSLSSHNTILDNQYQSLVAVLEDHISLFSEAIDQLISEFNRRVSDLVEQTQLTLSSTRDELSAEESRYKETLETDMEVKSNLIQITLNKTNDLLDDMREQFIIALNQAVAKYQMDLSDQVAKLENDFLNVVDKNGISIQNILNVASVSLTEPLKTFIENLEQLNDKIRKEEDAFLKKFESALTTDLLALNKDFQEETKKAEVELERTIQRLIKKLAKDINTNHTVLLNRLKTSQKNLQASFTNFSEIHERELRATTKELNSLTTKLERWKGESQSLLIRQINDRVNKSLEVLENEINEIITKIEEESGQSSKENTIAIVKESFDDISKSFKGFGAAVNSLLKQSLDEISATLKKESLNIKNRFVQFKKEQDRLVEETKKPSIKLIREIAADYDELTKQLINDIQKFFDSEYSSLKKTRQDLSNSLEKILTKRSTKSSKDINRLQEILRRSRENYLKKAESNLEKTEKVVIKEIAQLVDQEKNSRSTITALTEKIVSDLSEGVNSTAEVLRTNLWDGTTKVFGEAMAEINKQSIELTNLNEKLKENSFATIQALHGKLHASLDVFEQKTVLLHEKQIGNISEFKDKFQTALENDLKTKTEELQISRKELSNVSRKLNEIIQETIDKETFQTILELEAQTSGIEGAIFNTVGGITAEAARRTDSVVVIGEQAVLGIEERYVENLEQIRKNLTDEVIGKIEEEAKQIEKYKEHFKEIGRNHRVVYGEAMSQLNQQLAYDLHEAAKSAEKIFTACETISSKYLQNLNDEISAMGDRVGLTTDKLTEEILEDIDRVFQKVKREVALFARKQFELSNKSNQEIAEAFLKSVDDLEEVMLKQISSFTKRVGSALNRTKDISDIINQHIKDITETFSELRQK
ncbi:MAG: hypothetical protein ACTSVN_05475 [Candidatus Heimdallarchaeota archaeon]